MPISTLLIISSFLFIIPRAKYEKALLINEIKVPKNKTAMICDNGLLPKFHKVGYITVQSCSQYCKSGSQYE